MHDCGRITISHDCIRNIPNSSLKNVGNHCCKTPELCTSLMQCINAGWGLMSNSMLYPVFLLLSPVMWVMSREAAPKSPPASFFSPQNLYWHHQLLNRDPCGELAGTGQKGSCGNDCQICQERSEGEQDWQMGIISVLKTWKQHCLSRGALKILV